MCEITIDLYKTGLNIKSIRESKGITVKDIQKELGFTSPQAIYKWQDGKCLPTLDNIIILAKNIINMAVHFNFSFSIGLFCIENL